MKAKEFKDIFEETIKISEDVLIKKAAEYAGQEDRLWNFKQAATLYNTTPSKALGGMMVKHTISIYDMLSSLEKYEASLWDEKIIDSINYLILLRALLKEDS